MKLRILDDSIRLRLERSEVEALATGSDVAAHTHFPDGRIFGYRLRASTDTTAAFADDTITVSLPAADVSAWSADESAVSLRAELDVAGGRLSVLVEKDFECLEPRPGESQANRFRNPKAL